MNKTPVVSLIGRPNVGKSSLFNALMGDQHKAITHDRPGVTRDRHYGLLHLDEIVSDARDIILVDTGGFYADKIEINDQRKWAQRDEHFFNIMGKQAEMAISESDLILWVLDAREGLTPFDEAIAQKLRTQKTPVWILVNKFDSDKQRGQEIEFMSLGLEEKLFETSAAHRRGITNLLENIQHHFDEYESTGETLKGVAPNYPVVGGIAIIGAPNAGKSTLLNTLVGGERALVSPMAGTTVDPIEGFLDLDFADKASALDKSPFIQRSSEKIEEEYERYIQERGMSAVQEKDQWKSESEITTSWRSIKIVDTAGIRRKNMVKGFVESHSVYRALTAISESDVVVYMIDSLRGMSHQDRRLCDIALEKGCSLILVFNKGDLLEEFNKTHEKQKWLAEQVYESPWLEFCTSLVISAKNNQGIGRLLKEIKDTLVQRRTPFGTSALNRSLLGLFEKNQIYLKNAKQGSRFKMKYASQVKTAPPTFMLFCNQNKDIPQNYRRYLKNGLRKTFKVRNTPIHLVFKKSGEDLNTLL